MSSYKRALRIGSTCEGSIADLCVPHFMHLLMCAFRPSANSYGSSRMQGVLGASGMSSGESVLAREKFLIANHCWRIV